MFAAFGKRLNMVNVEIERINRIAADTADSVVTNKQYLAVYMFNKGSQFASTTRLFVCSNLIGICSTPLARLFGDLIGIFSLPLAVIASVFR
jgi:hypothetical protein